MTMQDRASPSRTGREQVDTVDTPLTQPITEWQAVAATGHGVYLIRCEQFVKIGRTVGLDQRMRTMQTGSPFDMWLAAYIYGGEAEERAVQQAFRRLRHRGEWYRFEGDLLDFAAAVSGARCPREAYYLAGQWFCDHRPRVRFYNSNWLKIWDPDKHTPSPAVALCPPGGLQRFLEVL